MQKIGINLQVHYIPLYRMKIIKQNLFNYKDKFSNSEYFYKSSFSIPIYPNLTIQNQMYVIKKIKQYLS